MALNSQGTILRIGDGATPENFTPIANVKRIGGIALGANDVDTSDLSSRWTQAALTLRTGGDVPVELNFEPTDASHIALMQSLISNDDGSNFEMEFPDDAGTIYEFAALVKSTAIQVSTGDVITMSCSLKITGQPSSLPGVTIT